MQVSPRTVLLLAFFALASCADPNAPRDRRQILVAAAANLTGVMEQLSAAFKQETGIEVVASFSSSAQLAQQIENGAPFDVFLSADTEHVDRLLEKGRILAGTRAVYARGQLVLWAPDPAKGIREMTDLTRPEIRFIAIAQPSFAPYGEAAVEALQAAGLWDTLQPKAVYANSINTARQYAETGNADAAFTAYSLVLHDRGTILKIDPALHQPIDQALGIVAGTKQRDLARRFVEFVLGPRGGAILRESGYSIQ